MESVLPGGKMAAWAVDGRRPDEIVHPHANYELIPFVKLIIQGERTSNKPMRCHLFCRYRLRPDTQG